MTGAESRTTATPLVDLSALTAGVLWRRRLWGSLALLGVLVGLVTTLVITPSATATTKVLIARVDDSATSQEALAETDVALFNTTATAGDAVRRLGLDVAPVTFAKTFRGEALTANILLITADGPTDSVAVQRADALAATFIAGHVGRARAEARAQSEALLDRRAELQRELTTAGTADPTAAGEASEDFLRQQANIAAQLSTLEEEAQQALAAVPRVEAGTRIVDPPRALNTPFLVSAAKNIGVGLALGLTLGIAFAAVLAVTRDRPVLRSEIATDLAVSVVSEIPARTRSGLRTRGRATRLDQRTTDTLVRLIRASPGRVSLLELGCARTAAALRDAIAGQLDGGDPVEVGSINPGTSWFELDALGSHSLLIVRAGQASKLWLHIVAHRLAEAGITPIGVVLVSPYPFDNTDGALWSGPPPAVLPEPATTPDSVVRKPEVQVS